MFKQLFARFIRKKHSADSIAFKHNTIYILPSTMGTGFIGVSVLNFLLGINYQNNLLLAVAYLMIMLLIIALLYGYANFNASEVKLVAINSAHCNTPPSVTLAITSNKRLLDFSIAHDALEEPIHIPSIERTVLQSAPLRLERGKHLIGQFKFVSHFPFGLVSVWSYLYLKKSIYAYPNPLENNESMYAFRATENSDELSNSTLVVDEFKQLTPFQSGMNMHRVSWKHYAKSQQLLVKEYEGELGAQTLRFDYAELQGTVEQRLSKLCYLVLEAEASDTFYAFKLGGFELSANRGEAHKLKCLEALCDY
ncbi:DUF58 domain-containing protein [Pseudoalteromonas sp. S16_S37]|uniref:DUF58 domain-containing protein n=1 Tax=Pseudoalteromonas sp. S16_S37 TaxID=2720228 RepID=UPI001681A0EF|nr:DUF58 domain-containing protein [Pseudoalteromonas sp. S16_S37]MBD1582165.1 DUF58 domain-containing protein [Pseudoalteromonas sp. S16_S37]